MQFIAGNDTLIARRGGETLRIEGWGRDSLRVRAVMYDDWTGNDYTRRSQRYTPGKRSHPGRGMMRTASLWISGAMLP